MVLMPPAQQSFDAKGLFVLPGIIDSQVHFRDPGMTHKEDFATGTRGAIQGGITAIFDMPNTKPNTSTKERYLEKLNIASDKAYCDFGLFAGATANNTDELKILQDLPGCCGIKIFMGSSTGDLLVTEEEHLENILGNSSRQIAVHCEDEQTLIERKQIAIDRGIPLAHPQWRNEESALLATQRIVGIAKKTGRKVHTLHITTAQEMNFLRKNKDHASVEILPQHLFFSSPDCYLQLGSFAQMNPPIRDKEHQKALWSALKDGVVDVIGSDHAPHTIEEKKQTYPQSPSGMPGVQTLVPIMLNFVNLRKLSLEKFVELTCINPARIYKAQGKGGTFIGQDGDFTIIDLDKEHVIKNDWMECKSGWTPYDGVHVKGWPVATIIRGNKVMENGEILAQAGKHIDFS